MKKTIKQKLLGLFLIAYLVTIQAYVIIFVAKKIYPQYDITCKFDYSSMTDFNDSVKSDVYICKYKNGEIINIYTIGDDYGEEQEK